MVILFEILLVEIMINIGVVFSDSEFVEDILVNFLVMFENGEIYVVFVNGIVGDVDNFFGFVVSVMGQEVSIDFESFQVMAFYGFFGVLVVDINDFGDVFFIMGLVYGEFIEGYFDLFGIQYFFEVCLVGVDDLVGIFIQNLIGMEGFVVVVFVLGIVGGDLGFNFLMVLFDGSVILFMLVVCV